MIPQLILMISTIVLFNINMHTSDIGYNMIKKSEAQVLYQYNDVGNLKSIGYGHLIKKNEHFPRRITEQFADSLLHKDIEQFEKQLKEVITVPLNQNQFDALISLVFNIGFPAFKKSTLLKYINKNQFDKARKQFLVWNKVNGKRIKGLTNRRIREMKLFMTPIK